MRLQLSDLDAKLRQMTSGKAKSCRDFKISRKSLVAGVAFGSDRLAPMLLG
jgi:hypothetical protein